MKTITTYEVVRIECDFGTCDNYSEVEMNSLQHVSYQNTGSLEGRLKGGELCDWHKIKSIVAPQLDYHDFCSLDHAERFLSLSVVRSFILDKVDL